MTLIRADLSLIKSDWNVHIILRSTLTHCYNSENYLIEVDDEEMPALYAALDSPQEDYSEFFDDLANLVLHGQEDCPDPSSVVEALHLYLHLLEKIKEI